MTIDGAAGSSLRRFNSIEDIAHLRYDITNLAYYLRPHGGACIIGVGGARDIQGAILFGHERIVGIDVNPVFINLLRHEFKDFAGVAEHEGVRLYVDEARSLLSRSAERYSLIQMSLIDTWAATGAGAFSLSENGLYTIEAWQVFIGRLADDGIFTVSRWYDPANLGETGRMVSLAVASLLRSGINDPSGHIAMATVDKISTLLLSKLPFSAEDIAALKHVSADLRYNIMILPGEEPLDATLRDIVSARSDEVLHFAVSGKNLNYEPPTDENPYFFNMLRLQHMGEAFHAGSGVLRGNLIASITLSGLILSLMAVALTTIVVPLKIAARRTGQDRRAMPAQFWSGALYFSLIGAGFMFVEIALIQRLSVFLGHPIYALGILLFTIILSSGLGSYLSERLPLTKSPWLFAYPLATAAIIAAMPSILKVLVSSMITSPIPDKIIASIVVIFPLGLFMGVFFPTGMRLVRPIVATETPWYWALNGIFGVLSSALAVFISIYFGISINFYIAAACYAALLISLRTLRPSHPLDNLRNPA
jgi:spermidine synthase